jgi:hypothetical protein
LIGPFCTLPLGLVRKNESSFRLIQYLSFLHHSDSVASVNSQVDASNFQTAWGTFDITGLLLSLPNGCQAAMFDVSSAYRITSVRPDQQWALVIHWDRVFYVDHALPFRSASSSGVFGSIADMQVALYNRSPEFGPMVKWVDDFFLILLPHQSWTEADFMDYMVRFGVSWSSKKLRTLNVVQRYIGFDWDLATRAVSAGGEKDSGVGLGRSLVVGQREVYGQGGGGAPREVGVRRINFPFNSTVPPILDQFLQVFSRLSGETSPSISAEGLEVDQISSQNTAPLSLLEPVHINWWGDASTSFGIGVVIGTHWAGWH